MPGPSVSAQLIITAQNNATSALQGAAADTRAVTGATTEAGNASQGTGLKITELYSTVRLAEMGIRALKGAYDDVVGSTLAYSDQVRQLQNTIGGTTEDASKLIFAANQTGVSFQTLSTALEASIRTMQTHKSQGIEPNIAGLAQLADAYNKIQDPILKTQFLQQNFGRSGADLAQMMALGSAGILALGQQAQATGVVLDQQTVGAMYRYEQETKTLAANLQGLKVATTEALLPALSGAVDQETKNAQAIQIMNAQVAAGHMSRADMIFDTIQIGLGLADTNKFVAQNITWLQGDSTASRQLRDDWNGLATAGGNVDTTTQNVTVDVAAQAKHVQDVTAYWERYTTVVIDAGIAQAQIRVQDVTQYWNNYAAAVQKAADAQAAQALSAGIAGTLTNNEMTYFNVLATNNPKIADLKDQIQKLTDAQGEQITTTVKGQYTSEQFTVAQERLSIAEQRLTEYHGKSKASFDSLQLSVRTAQDAIDQMTGHMGSSSTASADYTTKLGALNTQLFDLQVAEEKAQDAERKANATFMYDQAVAAAGDALSAQGKLDLANALGILDKKTYDAATGVLNYSTQLKNHAIDQTTYTADVQSMTDKLNGVTPVSNAMPAVLKPAITAFQNTAGAATAARDAIESIKDHSVTFTTNHVDNYITHRSSTGGSGTGGPDDQPATQPAGTTSTTTTTTQPAQTIPGGTGAAGLNMIVPPGYPNDSGLIRVSSGEHVNVGQGGSDPGVMAMLTGINQTLMNLPAMIGRAVRDNVTMVR